MKAILVHGWDGHPEEGWFPWLKKELEKRGFEVTVPQLPDAEKPRIEKWIPALAMAAGKVDENTYFIGHSMGCQAIVRYVESLPEAVKIGGAVFVGGFFLRLTGLENDADVQETDRHWLGSPVDFRKAKSHMRRSVAIFSDDDPYVPLDNQEDFMEKLGSEIIIEHNKGHYNESAGAFQVPSVLDAVLSISGKDKR
ncbi:MAG: serine hydrolase family protein [Candidatus Aenigmarchaeota archaeon]|nr:serine hydrolase family protein [Candidatus Aenigmarchaeota archaeon]